MSRQAVYEYLIAVLTRYQQGNKTLRSKLLAEAILITGLSRKHIIRKLNSPQKLKNKGLKSGRPPRFCKETLSPFVREVWVDMDRVSGKIMKAGLEDWLPFYDEYPPHIKSQINSMSASTIERFLRNFRYSDIKKGLSLTKPAHHMKNMFPLHDFTHRSTKPGFMQADTVAHCGDSGAGAFISSLTLTDTFCGWTNNRALYTKIAINVRRKIADIEQNMPFPILGINFDSGSEFINTEMLNFGRTESGKQRIALTRSRPYKKNDQCFVEQKNFTHVRGIFGYERLEEEALVGLMDDIYKNYWNPYHNFFMPQFKLKEKTRVGSKIRKKHFKPKTPYQQLMDSGSLTEEQREILMKKKESYNPRELKKNLEIKLKEFFQKLKEFKLMRAA